MLFDQPSDDLVEAHSEFNIEQYYLDYYKDLPDYKTEEELHRAIFRHELNTHMNTDDHNAEVSKRYSQWLSTRLQGGVFVPRPSAEMNCLHSEMSLFPRQECRTNGKFCCLLHEILIRDRLSKGGYPRSREFYARSKGPTYF
jgi:hypothetical protein